MKKQYYISLFLALTISLLSLKSFLVMSYYIVFTDSFIENYCINTDKPELNCDGKCYLSELLEKDSTKNDEQEKMMLISSAELVFCFQQTQNDVSGLNFIQHSKPIDHINQLYTFDFLEKHIKPPIDLIYHTI